MSMGSKYSLLDYDSAYEIITDLFNQNKDFNRLMKDTLDIMGNLLNIDMLSLYIFGQQHSLSDNHYTWKNVNLDDKLMNARLMPIWDSFLKSIGNKSYLKLDDIKKDKTFFRKIYKLFHIKSICIFPVRVDGQIIAGIFLKYYTRRFKFKDEQIEFTLKCQKLIENRLRLEYKKIILKMSKNNYMTVFENSIFPLMLIDFDFNLIQVNNTFEQLFQITFEDLKKNDYIDFISGNERSLIIDFLKRGMNKKADELDVFKMINGNKKIIRILTVPVADETIELLALIFQDITDKKLEEKKMIKLAYIDDISNLRNRHAYELICDELDRTIYNSLGVVTLRINQLSQFIMDHSRKKANQLIKNCASVLSTCLEEEYFLSRIYDDLMIVFIKNQSLDYVKEKFLQLQKLLTENKLKDQVSITYTYLPKKLQYIKNIVDKIIDKAPRIEKDETEKIRAI